MKARPWLALALALVALPAAALDVPGSSRQDSRMRRTVYDPDNIVRLRSCVGMAIRIVLEPGESYVDHGFGDGNAWEGKLDRHYVTIRPIAEQAGTNFFIQTDRRRYAFLIQHSDNRAECWPDFELAFHYPESERRQAAAAAEQDRIEAAFAGGTGRINLQYWASGRAADMAALKPLYAWDDGLRTYFQFHPQQDIPAVFSAGPNGEAVVNFHMGGPNTDVMVVHAIEPAFTLRAGELAVRVWNADPRGIETGTRTASPWVERQLKGEGP